MLFCALTLSNVVYPWSLFLFWFFFFFFFFSLILDMAPKIGRKFKNEANRNLASSSSPALPDRVRFPTAKTEQIFETLTKYRSIWGKDN